MRFDVCEAIITVRDDERAHHTPDFLHALS